MYSVGSLADLISGSQTQNKPTLQLKQVAVKPKKPIEPQISAPPKPKTNIKSPNKSSGERKSFSDKGNDKNYNKFNAQKKPVSKTQMNALKRLKNKQNKQEANASSNTNPKQSLKRKSNDDLNDSDAKVMKKDKPTDSEEKKQRTVFVGNVPISASNKELKKLFSKFGKIETIRIRGVASADPRVPKKVAFIKKQFHSNATSFQCFIVFSTKEEALKCIEEAKGLILKDHHLRIDSLTAESKPDQKKAIFIGNVPFSASDDEVWKLFQDCGNIESVRLVRDSQTQIGKGFGYVNFDSADAVELAMQMEDVKLGNRSIRISRCSEKLGKKRTPDGQKIRKVPRKPKVQKSVDNKSEEFSTAQTEEFQGSQFNDKKKKKKFNKEEWKKKKMSELLTSN